MEQKTANSPHLRESAKSAGRSASGLTEEQVGRAGAHPSSQVVISDFLGTTLGTVSGEQFAPVHLTAFGEVLTADNTNITEGSPSDIHSGFGIQDSEFSAAVFYTGKPYDEDLQAYHFLYRNYSPTKGRWTAADPSGFPDGPNQWLYVNNGVTGAVDPLGLAETVYLTVTQSSIEGYTREWEEKLVLANVGITLSYQNGLGGSVTGVFQWQPTGQSTSTPVGGKPELPTWKPEDDPNGNWRYLWRWVDPEPIDMKDQSPPRSSAITYSSHSVTAFSTRTAEQTFHNVHEWVRKAELVEIF